MPPLEKPRLWIVAGPNGSGKSTLYGRTDIKDFGRSVWIINPDILTAHIARQERLPLAKANAETLDRIHAWLRISIRTYKTVGVETVLSTPKYRRLVRSAKAHGFEFSLLYVTLRTADLNIERVRARVKAGGHDVPAEKIVSRREKSFKQLPWFLDQADFALIYDNSSREPVAIGRKENGVIVLDPAAPEEIKRAVRSLRG